MRAVRAPLQMLRHPPGAPLSYTPEAAGSGAEEVWPGEYHPAEVEVSDARAAGAAAPAEELNTRGFTLAAHCSAVVDFHDDAAVCGAYYAEVEALLRQALPGVRSVFIFDHTRRSDVKSVQLGKCMRQPASKVHGDYTHQSGLDRLGSLPEAVRAAAAGRRFQIVNVWRSTNGPVRRSPLAFCDARTVPAASYVPMRRVAPTRTGEVYVAVHHPAMRWAWFPDMHPAEVALFKTFDSDPAAPARFCLHSAFPLPDTPPDAPPRESIETRAVVIY
eukprot:TRINITY_DN33341_c0_g1_i1.p2 TRINITY_DN33341_c0_g1~~TRINITY_DN33341_c0_g1_i1.p2  ORF type:complete len:274 (+),score=77.06 TRINITY_DN33341_c0_g1_i1:56-877(+)